MFNIDKCKSKKVWCGNSANPPSKNYKKVGTRFECLKQGFGAGAYSERVKSLPQSSLQRIPYVGPEMEASFHRNGIKTIQSLIKKMKVLKTQQSKAVVLRMILRNKNNAINTKAFNSVVLYLHGKGIMNLPNCY